MVKRGINALRSSVETKPDGSTLIVLSGAIDENSVLESVFARVTGKAVVNMRGVERINSMGVHNWIPLVQQASQQHPLAIDEISYAMVQNAVAVANMFGTADVRSCMAPYFCSRCKDHRMVTVSRDDVEASGDQPPVKLCPKCAAPMDFDELDNYFSFFKIRKAR